MAPPTYGKTWWRDGYACGCMILSIENVVEPRLREAGFLGQDQHVGTYQQAYNSSVGASAGTHSGGGALDHYRAEGNECKIWRECGWADWPRGAPYDSMDIHSHGIVCGCPHLSPDAEDQEYDYKNGRNGLANNGPDPGPDVPYITWNDAYDKYVGKDDQEGGLFGMTKRIGLYRGKSQVFQEDNWNHDLATNDEGHATIATNTNGMCDVILSITDGLEPGDEIGVRWRYLGIKGDSTNVDWQSQPIDLVHNGGTSRHQVVCHFDLKPEENGWDHKLRLAVNTGGKRVTFGTIETKGWED